LRVTTFIVGLVTIVGGVPGWTGCSCSDETDEQAICMLHKVATRNRTARKPCRWIERFLFITAALTDSLSRSVPGRYLLLRILLLLVKPGHEQGVTNGQYHGPDKQTDDA